MNAKVKAIYLLHLKATIFHTHWPPDAWVELVSVNGQKMSMERRQSAVKLLERLSPLGGLAS